MLKRPTTKLFATVSDQGTAMYETVLTKADYNNPTTRAETEAMALKTPDVKQPLEWHDVTENEAFWEEEEIPRDYSDG